MTQPKKAEWYADGLRFTCTQCGNCCSGSPGYVWFSDEEAQAMADFLALDVKVFLRRYARTINGRWTLTERKSVHGYDCVFLRRDDKGKALCGIYPVRPTQCKTWPFWPELLRTRADWNAAAQRCPGIKAGTEGNGTFYPVEQVRITRDSNPR